MIRSALFAAALTLPLTPVLADDVTDTLNSALEAYEEGDIDYAIEELDYAKGLLQAMKTQALEQFLPEAPDGWSLEVDSDMGAGMAMLGGGLGTKGTYTKDGERFTITILVNNPMVTAFGGMLANATMLGMKVERVGREKFLNDDGELTGLVDDRILVKAEGGDTETMLEVIKSMDFKALGDFGS